MIMRIFWKPRVALEAGEGDDGVIDDEEGEEDNNDGRVLCEEVSEKVSVRRGTWWRLVRRTMAVKPAKRKERIRKWKND